MFMSVTFVLSAVQFLSAAASPVEVPRGTKIALNKRTSFAGPDGVADLAAIQKHFIRSTAKIQAGFTAYKRNTGTAHPLAGVGGGDMRRRAADIALADDMRGEMWQGAIAVGTPPQNFSVDFDTGSSDLLLPGPLCTTNCEGHQFYHPEHSKTGRDLYHPFSLSYGDGASATGSVWSDTVHIAGFKAINASVGAAETYSDHFAPWNFFPDGLMGMAFRSLSVYNDDPVFQTLTRENQVKEQMFAFKLGDDGAELSVGGVNDDLYKGEFTYTPVTHQSYWQVSLGGASVNGNKTLGNMTAIVDTGTTLVIGDADDVSEFFASVPGAKPAPDNAGRGFYTIPCNATPDVSLTFGKTAFNMSKELFNLGPISRGSPECMAGIVGQKSQGFWIIGDIFLRSVYTVFDVENARVGFASLA